MDNQSWGALSMTSESFKPKCENKKAKNITAVTVATDDAIQQMMTSQKCRDHDVTERKMN